MKRTAQTSKAIMSKNSSIKDFNYWTIARERYMGDFEFDRDRCKSLRPIDDAIVDRDKKAKGPPNGESLANLRRRVRQFLQEIQKEALKLQVESPSLLVVTHNQFMFELYSLISDSDYGKSLTAANVRYQNTGIATYIITTTYHYPEMPTLERVECPVLSCAHHLKNHDENYDGCNGRCHSPPKFEITD